jgi:hypothetical protein
MVNHYFNLRPLWHEDNIRKGRKVGSNLEIRMASLEERIFTPSSEKRL